MSTVVNLNKFRKAQVRADKSVRASENAVKFGRTKGEKMQESLQSIKETRDLDGKKRE